MRSFGRTFSTIVRGFGTKLTEFNRYVNSVSRSNIDSLWNALSGRRNITNGDYKGISIAFAKIMGNSDYKIIGDVSTSMSIEVLEKIKEIMRLSKEFKKEINQTLQIANRRIQNIELSGVASPAYLALKNELGGMTSWNRYSKFSIGNLNLLNPSDVTKAVNVYSRALAYINNQTSTVTGAREFVKKLALQNNIPFDVANDIIKTIMEPQITNGEIVINNFDSERVRGMVSEYADLYNEFNDDYETLKEDIRDRVNELLLSVEETLDIWD